MIAGSGRLTDNLHFTALDFKPKEVFSVQPPGEREPKLSLLLLSSPLRDKTFPSPSSISTSKGGGKKTCTPKTARFYSVKHET